MSQRAEWARATATFFPVANYDDGTIEQLSRTNFRESGATSFGVAFDEVIVYGTPDELIAFGERFTAYAQKITGQLVESEYDRQRTEHDCSDPLCAGLPYIGEVGP